MLVKNILLVDDHLVIRTGLKAMLVDYYPQIRVFEAKDGDETIKLLKHNRIDILLLDLQIPNTDTVSLVEFIAIKYPQVYIMIFSMLPEGIYARRLIKAGASGFLPKDSPQEEMKRAFEMAFNGRKYFSPRLTEILAEEVASNLSVNPFDRLSHREFEIVRLLLSSNSLSKIASNLNLKPSTVGTYKSRIFEKLQIETIFELKELAILYSLGDGKQ
jgi:two-component system, NarL family, invasion response regulator UvrY